MVTGHRVFLPRTETIQALYDGNLASYATFPSFFHLNILPMASQMSVYISEELCKLHYLPLRVGRDVNMLTKKKIKTFMMEVCEAQTILQGTTCQVMFSCSSVPYDDELTLFVGFPKGGNLNVSELKFHSMP